MGTIDNRCPCGSGKLYADCCARLHAGAPAADAESLMRSRYSAYVLGLGDYLKTTWFADTRPTELDLSGGPKWLGLDVLNRASTGPGSATVEFVACYRVGGRAGRMHEVSRFVREDGRWFYVDGETI